MKIAQVAGIGERVPPKKYGGTERVVSALTEELVRRGHEVTLFASGDSITSARLVSVTKKPLRELSSSDMFGSEYLSILNVGLAYKMQDEFDIIHDHNVYTSLPIAMLSKTPILMTLHGAVTLENRKLLYGLNNKYNPFFVTISKAQAVPLPSINYIGNIYHGLEMTNYPISVKGNNFLLFVGRISSEKGLHHAIEAAEYLNLPLTIAAKLDPNPVDLAYFKEKIEPHLSETIQWIGEVDTEQRNVLMSNAIALLHPVTWREPFGLTLIEAMACGCPIVAFNRGSIPEIVKHEKTGFIVEDTVEMVEVLGRIKEIKREDCRNYVLEKFSLIKMVDAYESIYKKIISNLKKS